MVLIRALAAALVLVFASPLGVSGASAVPGKLTPLQAVPALALELKDSTGKLHRLSDYRGKVVLVNFWATWCEPCRDEMPSMQKLKERIDQSAAGSLVILAVNHGEGAARVDAFLKQMPLNFPILLDPFTEVSRAWKPGVLPASYLIGKDGRVYYRVIGEIDWTGAEAAAAIKRLLQAKA